MTDLIDEAVKHHWGEYASSDRALAQKLISRIAHLEGYLEGVEIARTRFGFQPGKKKPPAPEPPPPRSIKPTKR